MEMRTALPRRTRWVYTAVFVELTLVILVIFFEPAYNRLVNDLWKRGKTEFFWTLSLDVHAVAGYVLLSLVVAQFIAGLGANRRRLRWLHRALGRILLGMVLPAFAVTALWVVMDRSYAVPDAYNVLYTHPEPQRWVMRMFMTALPVAVVVFMVRAWLAIRRGDVPAHIDGVLAAFVFTATVGLYRLVFALCWVFLDSSPFTPEGVAVLSIGVVMLHLVVPYALVGRLRDNARALLTLLTIAMLGFAITSPWYTLFADDPTKVTGMAHDRETHAQ